MNTESKHTQGDREKELTKRYGPDRPLVVSYHWLLSMQEYILEAKNSVDNINNPFVQGQLRGEEIFSERVLKADGHHSFNKIFGTAQDLLEALQLAVRIKDLWVPVNGNEIEHEGEAQALCKMYDTIEAAINKATL